MRRVLVALIVGVLLAAALWQFRQRHQARLATPQTDQPASSSEWLDHLYSRNPREVEAATQEVTRLGAAALPAIQSTMHDPQAQPERLKAALKACGILGRTAAPLAGDVAELLLEPGLTAEAAIALSHMGPQAFPALRDATSEQDPTVRREALRSIGKMRDRASLDSDVVVPLLVEHMKDSDEGVRAVAATYLGIIHDRPEESVRALIAGLSDPADEVRRMSAGALGSFDPQLAAPALPALRKASRDRNPDVAREAGQAMVKLRQK